MANKKKPAITTIKISDEARIKLERSARFPIETPTEIVQESTSWFEPVKIEKIFEGAASFLLTAHE